MKCIFLIFFLPVSFFAVAQDTAKKIHKPVVVSSYPQYLKSVKTNPDNELIELKKVIPDIKLDIRYATKNNFMQQVMYQQGRAFARKPVAELLKKIQKELSKKGYGLKIYDGYRPYAITVAFYKKASDKNFVSNPAKGSIHNRGCAVDLTLINLKTGAEIPMPTPYDSFSAAAAANYDKLTPEVKKNRDFLIAVMQKYNMLVRDNEWWHYDFSGWKSYNLMDIPFEKL